MKRTLLLLIAAATSAAAPQTRAAGVTACEAPAEVRSAIFGVLNRPQQAQWNVGWVNREKLAEIVPQLLERFPADFWVERLRIDAARGPNGTAPDSLIAEYRGRYQAAPNDPGAAYLYGYSLIHKDTHRTIELLTPLASGDSVVPAAMLTLADIHSFGGQWDWSTDPDRTRTLAEAYLKRCPGALDGSAIAVAQTLRASPTLAAYVTALRERIAGKADAGLLKLYGPLWALEGSVAPPAEAAAVGARITADLKFVQGLDPKLFPGAAAVLALGEARASGRSDVPNLPLTDRDWQKTNPKPKGEAGHQAVQDWQRKRLVFLNEWIANHPGNLGSLLNRFVTLAALDETPNETILHEGEKLLASSPGEVADAWASRGIALDRVLALIERDIELCRRDSAFWDSDLYRGSYRAELRKFIDTYWWLTFDWRVLSTAYEKAGKLEEARAVLVRWSGLVIELRQLADDARRRVAALPAAARNSLPPVALNLPSDLTNSAEPDYSLARARLAVAEGNKLDALLHYRAALTGKPIGEADADVVDEARTLFNQLGGTAETWSVWANREKPNAPNPASPTQWMATERPLPVFSLPDRNGKTWTLANLKGKTTLVSVWATWCGPCREELPQVQALYEKLAGRHDVQLVTLNLDQQKTLVDPYMRTQKFTFPVLYGYDLLLGEKGLLNRYHETGIPQSWIVDESGIIRSRLLDFDGYSGGNWLTAAEAALARVAGK